MIKNILKIIAGLLIVAVVYVAYMILFPVSPKGEAGFEADGVSFQVEESWTVALSSKNDVFFAVSQPDPKMNVLKTTALAQKLDPELEQFTIDFSQDSTSVNLNLKWDSTIVSIPIE